MEKLEIGQIVKSKSGRDKDRLFIVTKVLENGYVNVVDGKYKTLQNPKLKNIVHLKNMKHVATIQIDADAKDQNNQNATIRKELKRLGNEMEEVVYV